MKDKVWKWMRHNWGVLLLVIAVLMLGISGSFAAYTSFNSVKRVVSTGKGNDTLFGSNYLSLVGISDTSYTIRRISPTEVKDENGNVTGYIFTVQVYNYISGNPATYNPKDITYTFRVEVVPKDEGNLPDGITGIKVNDKTFSTGVKELPDQKLQTGKSSVMSYQFFVPSALKDQVNFKIEAIPTDDSMSTVDSQKIAAILSLSDLTLTEDWTGKFIDAQNNETENYTVSDYDAFNYEISGNGKGTVTLTWDASILQISKWFLNDVQASEPKQAGNSSNYSCTFEVGNGGDSSNSVPVTAYQLQFFRKPGVNYGGYSWDDLDRKVDVTFTSAPSAE